MHFQGVDLNLLVALDALLSERSVTRAAERIHISQPGMSAALQKLRWHFSDQVLERVGRRLELTPLARELAEPLKELLFKVRQILDTEPSFNPLSARRTFRICMSGYCTEVLGTRLVQYLMTNAPHVACEIDELSADALSRVNDGQIDFCITVDKKTAVDPSYVAETLLEQPLFSDRFVLAAAADNEQVGSTLTYEAFCKQLYIEVRFGRHILSLVECELRSQPRRPETRACAPTFAAALSIVAQTKAVAVVPFRLFQLYKDLLRLKCVEPPFKLNALTEICLWHGRNDADPGHRWFRHVLQEIAPGFVVRGIEDGGLRAKLTA